MKMNPNSVIKKADMDKNNELGRYNNDPGLNDSFDKAYESSNSNYDHSPRDDLNANEFRENPTNEVNNDLFPRKSNLRNSKLKPEQQEQINLDLNELTQEDKFFLI